ncbi:MAG: hypothetical protein K6G78_04885, partial [bacterium]|nr:hypothetical protein [bacterium]
ARRAPPWPKIAVLHDFGRGTSSVAKKSSYVRFFAALLESATSAMAKPQVRGLVRFCDAEVPWKNRTKIEKMVSTRPKKAEIVQKSRFWPCRSHVQPAAPWFSVKNFNLCTIFSTPIRKPSASFSKTAG